MNFSITSDQRDNTTGYSNIRYVVGISLGQLIGIIIGSAALFTMIGACIVVVLFQKCRSHANKLSSITVTSSNPSGRSEGHGHCNMTVPTNFYDIDDLSALDNDSFLNSLEHAVFVGYRKEIVSSVVTRPRSSDPPGCPHNSNNNGKVTQKPITDSVKNSNKIVTACKHSSRDTSLKMRTQGSKRSMSAANCDRHSVKKRSNSKVVGSTSNLITSSKMFLDDSNDSVFDCSRESQQLTNESEVKSQETNVDFKPESSTDSHASVNSTSAMMHTTQDGRTSTSIAEPDAISITLPRTSKSLHRPSSSSSTVERKDNHPTMPRGQILDPVRASRNINFNQAFRTKGKLGRHFSYNVGPFEYDVPS